MLEIVLLGTLAGVSGVLVENARRRSRWVALRGLISDRDPEGFLAGVDSELTRRHYRRSPYRQLYVSQKSVALMYMGRFQEAYDLLEAVPRRTVLGKARHVFYHNLLLAQLVTGRIEDARRTFTEQQVLWDQPGSFAPFMEGSRANFEWYAGDRGRARELLERLVAADGPPIYKVGPYYLLGLAAEAEGQLEQARRYWALSADVAPNHWAGRASRHRLTEGS